MKVCFAEICAAGRGRPPLTIKGGGNSMPIFEYRCGKCGEVNEFLVLGTQDGLACKKCGSEDLVKLMSAHNVSGGSSSFSPPAPAAAGAADRRDRRRPGKLLLVRCVFLHALGGRDAWSISGVAWCAARSLSI